MAATDHTLNPRAGANPSAAPNRLVRRRAVIGLLTGAPLLAACGGDPLSSDGGGQGSGGSGSGGGGGGTVRVGSANFPESEIIGELYAQVLEAKGLTVERKMQIGSREVYLGALKDGSIDLIGEYTGNLLAFYDKQAKAKTSEEVFAALQKALPDDLEVLAEAKAENKDAWCAAGDWAKQHGISSYADLKDYDGTLRVGGPPEMSQRDYGAGLARVESVYGVPADRMEFTPISDGGGPLTVKALKDGDVDLANIFSTTPAIEENGFVMLEDPEGMVTPQNIVPLMAKDRVTDQIREAVESVQKVLTTEDLMAMNAENSGEQKKQPREVAGEWLKEKGLV